MKKLLLSLLLIMMLFSCGEDKPIFKRSPAEVTFTSVEYAHSWMANDNRSVTAKRTTFDTTRINGDRVEWFRDTLYEVPIPVDTLRDNIGRPILDSLGRSQKGFVWAFLPDSLLLVDYNKNWKK